MSVLKEQLLEKINNKTAKVGVVGLGYVLQYSFYHY